MLSVQDNELMCRVGPGTPMGDLMRQYWIPALLPSELPTVAGYEFFAYYQPAQSVGASNM